MNIQKAVKKALKTKSHIARETAFWFGKVTIQPTNIDNCVLHGIKKAPQHGWQPSAEDLIANDWVVVKRME